MTPQELVSRNPYTPQGRLVQRLLETSPNLTELTIVLEWLKSMAPGHLQLDHRSSYRMYTKRKIQQNLRQGDARQDRLVRLLDPDALSRDPGLTLDREDLVC